MCPADHLNRLPEDDARALLLTCLRSDDWAAAVLAGRPYAEPEDLESAAMAAARALSPAALSQALSAHPRIGERASGTGAEARMSAAEQSGVSSDESTRSDLLAANLAYEERFGHVFLIRAAGRDATEILAAARDRLGNDSATEGRVVREQLGEIAVLRLRASPGGPPTPSVAGSTP